MVIRQSDALQIAQPNQPAVAQSGMGMATPKPDSVQDTSQYDRVLGNIVGNVESLATKYIKSSQEEAYLDGAAKAGIIQSEEELSSDPLTKDWAVAGYRDTMGRLALADHDAQLQADMKTMAEATPEKYQEYLAAKRADILPSLEGMSAAQRKASMGTVLMTERSAIAKHTVEHAKFIVDQEKQSISTNMNVKIGAMNSSKSDPTAYSKATDAAYASIVSDIVDNQKLLPEHKADLIEQTAQYALGSDNMQLYDKMQNVTIDQADGSKKTIMQLLPLDKQFKIDEMYRKAKQDTLAIRSAQFEEERAKAKAGWDDPNQDIEPHDVVDARIKFGLEQGFMKQSDVASDWNDYYTKSAKKDSQGLLAQAAMAGDMTTILRLGKTRGEALDALVAVQARKGKPVGDIASSLITTALKTGQMDAMTKAGDLMKPAIQQLGNDGKLNPDNAQMIQATLALLDKAELDGNKGAFAAYVSGFDSASQDKLLYMREEMRKGADPVTAVTAAQERQIKDKTARPGELAIIQAENGKQDLAIAQSVDAQGYWMRFYHGAVGLLPGSTDSNQINNISPKKSWFENADRVNAATAGVQNAMIEELRVISRTSPTLSQDSRATKALAAVSARTVPTEGGPLIIPRGASMTQYFGLKGQVGAERVGAAIDAMVKPRDSDSRIVWESINDKLRYVEYGSDGGVLKTGMIDPKTVSNKVAEQLTALGKRYGQESGAGVTRTTSLGVKVQFNGQNSAGVDPATMLEFRQNLVNHEGITDVPYKDKSGKLDAKGNPIMTVGAGVSSHNPYYPQIGANGKVTQDGINTSFMGASNDAAKTGYQIAARSGTLTKPAVLLYSELAYQSGTGFTKIPVYTNMIQAIKVKDSATAMSLLKQSPAYTMSAANGDRRKHYENLITQLTR